MTDQLTAALAYAQENQHRFLEELMDFVKIPSISTDPLAKVDILRAAEWLVKKLHELGAKNVQIMPTLKHPVVYGEILEAGPGRPTVLVYGHYDVQPPEPLELWESPPFEPQCRGDYLYGRGASDMKGQIMTCLNAIQALEHTGGLGVNLKFLLEGEEEIGSPDLEQFIQNNRALLACDLAINPDTGMLGVEMPTITYGLRGLAYFEIRMSGPSQDLHSGLFGGTVHNPAQVLCELIAGMHDAQGRITLPGFYDRVRPLEAEERAEMARLPMDEAFYLQQTGASQLYGEAGYTPNERVTGRPTLEVNGFLSGYTGEGVKTVLPSKAMAKISTRLVPDQDPAEVRQQLQRYLETHAPPTVHWELIQHSGSPASIVDLHIPAVQALSRALEETWGKRPVYRREGGSVPVVSYLNQFIGVPSVLTGFGLPDDNLHAPNEKLHLPTFFHGLEAMTRYLFILGA
jgi:acetylornithine deacetylase/succinyl-diaminopimelate desuccinylase-like protein